MSNAVPGRVVAVGGRTVTIDHYGRCKTSLNEFLDLNLGDYVYTRGGYVVSQASPAEAESIIAAWKKIFFEPEGTDLRASRMPQASRDRKLGWILDKSVEGEPLTDTQAEYLLGLEEQQGIDLLQRVANFIRHRHHGNRCWVQGIIDMADDGKKRRTHSAMSGQNGTVNLCRTTSGKILDVVGHAAALGFRTLVLQPGQAGRPTDDLAGLVAKAASRFPWMIFIACGEVSRGELRELHGAGARGVLLPFETSDPALYKILHPKSSLEKRLEVLHRAREEGFLIATGGWTGLPGQSRRSLIDDLRLASQLNAEVFSFGPFLSHPGAHRVECNLPRNTDILKLLAVARLLAPPRAKILAAGDLEIRDPGAYRPALEAGCNALMFHIAPPMHRMLSRIEPGRMENFGDNERRLAAMLDLLNGLGLVPADFGGQLPSGQKLPGSPPFPLP